MRASSQRWSCRRNNALWNTKVERGKLCIFPGNTEIVTVIFKTRTHTMQCLNNYVNWNNLYRNNRRGRVCHDQHTFITTLSTPSQKMYSLQKILFPNRTCFDIKSGLINYIQVCHEHCGVSAVTCRTKMTAIHRTLLITELT